MTAPARDYLRTGHDDRRTCQCDYHRRLRVEPVEPDYDPRYDPED